MENLYSLKTCCADLKKSFKWIGIVFLVVFVLAISARHSFAQATIQTTDTTTICAGESTTFNIKICDGYSPWTVTYTDGTSNYTVTNYNSNCDPESGPEVGDDITVSPTVTTTYTLVSVTFGNPVLSVETLLGSVTVTVNPLPSNISVSPSSPVCFGQSFSITATATNATTFELWNATNTSKVGGLPYSLTINNISDNRDFYVRAISSATPPCTTSVSYTVPLDNTSPTITCSGPQTVNPESGSCATTIPNYTSGYATVSDNCTADGSITVTQSPAAGTSISGHGTVQTITLTATDEVGNFSTCDFEVTLVDNINPTISCVANQTVPASSSCTYTHTGTGWDPSGADNCNVASVTYSADNGLNPATGTSLAGLEFQPGTTTVTWTVTDGAGNTGNCSFQVSIDDSIDPTITFNPGSQSESTDDGACTYTHNDDDWNVVATDNCGTPTASYVLSGATTGTVSTLNGVTFNKGTTNVAVTVSDGASTPNTATTSFSVEITDGEDPTITCPGNISENVESGCSKSITIPVISFDDNCTGSSITWSSSGATTFTSQTGQIGTKTFNVGTTQITVTVTDAAGRNAQCTFTVTVSDNIPPTVTCPDNITANTDAGQNNADVAIPTIVFDDNCDSETLSWSYSGNAGTGQPGTKTFPIGETTVTLTVTDAASNTSSCSFTVTVTDNEKPVISCPTPAASYNADAGECTTELTFTATATDNSGSTTIHYYIGTPETEISFPYDFPVGTTTVTARATDTAGNTDVCTFNIVVVDNQVPVISGCPANLTRTSSAGSCNALVSWTEPTATDNCTSAANLVWTKSHTPGSTFAPGTTTVTYTVEDEYGNVSAECSFDVTVTDNQKPIISGCPSNQTIYLYFCRSVHCHRNLD